MVLKCEFRYYTLIAVQLDLPTSGGSRLGHKVSGTRSKFPNLNGNGQNSHFCKVFLTQNPVNILSRSATDLLLLTGTQVVVQLNNVYGDSSVLQRSMFQTPKRRQAGADLFKYWCHRPLTFKFTASSKLEMNYAATSIKE